MNQRRLTFSKNLRISLINRRMNANLPFFAQAINYMDENFPIELCHQIRDASAYFIGRWRMKAMQKIAHEGQIKIFEEKLVSSLSNFFELYSEKGV